MQRSVTLRSKSTDRLTGVNCVVSLVANPTLRYVIGRGADALIRELRGDHQSHVDDVVIGQGLTLLRYTGQIDAEGRGWLIEALRRQAQDTPGREYGTMLDDPDLWPKRPST